MLGDEAADKQEIDLVVSQFFAVFNNQGGKTASLDDLNELFVPGCVIVKTCGTSPIVYSLSGQRFEAKGMKSIQLVNTEQGWRICSVVWDDERDGKIR